MSKFMISTKIEVSRFFAAVEDKIDSVVDSVLSSVDVFAVDSNIKLELDSALPSMISSPLPLSNSEIVVIIRGITGGVTIIGGGIVLLVFGSSEVSVSTRNGKSVLGSMIIVVLLGNSVSDTISESDSSN